MVDWNDQPSASEVKHRKGYEKMKERLYGRPFKVHLQMGRTSGVLEIVYDAGYRTQRTLTLSADQERNLISWLAECGAE